MYVPMVIALLLLVVEHTAAQWVRIDTVSYTALYASGDAIIGGYKDVLDPKIRISTNGGLSWHNASTTMQSDDRVEVFEKHKGNFYAGLVRDIFWDTCSTCGGVYRSTDGGMSWHLASAGIPLSPRADIRTLLDYGDTIFAGGSIFQVPPSLYLSTDAGSQWHNIGDTSLNYFGIGTIVLCGERLFFNGGTSQSPTIWYSTNSGRSWVAGDSGFPSGAKALTLECFGDRLFTVARDFWSTFVLATEANTIRWRPVHAGLNDPYDGRFATRDSVLFLVTAAKLYFLRGTSDTVWKEVRGAPGVGAPAVSEDYLFVNGSGGLWRRPISEVVAVSESLSHELPTVPVLETNYPNPFNASTTTRFRLARRQYVTMKVYDILGKEVNVLVDGVLESGLHQLTFDGSHLSTGVYVLRLFAGTTSQSVLMLLLR